MSVCLCIVCLSVSLRLDLSQSCWSCQCCTDSESVYRDAACRSGGRKSYAVAVSVNDLGDAIFICAFLLLKVVVFNLFMVFSPSSFLSLCIHVKLF